MGRNGDESNYPNYRFVLPASYRQRPEIGLIPISLPHFPTNTPYSLGSRIAESSGQLSQTDRPCSEALSRLRATFW